MAAVNQRADLMGMDTDFVPGDDLPENDLLSGIDNQITTRPPEIQPCNQVDVLSNSVAVTLQQAVASLELINQTSLLLASATENATFEQKLLAVQEARKLVDTTSAAIRTTADLYLTLGIKVNCDTHLDVSSLIPASFRSNRAVTQPGFEKDVSLPSASRYTLTLRLIKPTDISPRALLDLLLRGSGCQVVGRTEGKDFVTVRLENKTQLTHALSIMRVASYQGTLISTFVQISSTTKSAYSIRSFPFSSSIISTWFDSDGNLNIDTAINELIRDNSGWFPDSDVESVEFYKSSPPQSLKHLTDCITLKIFISHAAYRHFLRSSHDITNVDCHGHLLKFKEEVTIIQCWKCCSFGHYSNQCTASFKCRYCLTDHAQNYDCPGKVSPQCRNCVSNNEALKIKLQSGDSSAGILHYEEWHESRTDHSATSGVCKAIQWRKSSHLQKLKKAAFACLPLPPFKFP